MPLITFSPSIAPSPGNMSKPEVSLFKAEFGDGYTQSGPRGLNHIREQIDLKWDGITLLQKQELDAFFRERGGYKPFSYQPYGYSASLNWICVERSSSSKSPFTFTAKFKQDFSLAS